MSIENNIHPGWGGWRALWWLVTIVLLVLLIAQFVLNGLKFPSVAGMCGPVEVAEVVQPAPVVVEPAPVVEVVEPVVVSPYVLTAAVDANRNAVLNGYVPDQAAMDSIEAAAVANYGSGNVVNNLEIVDGAPANWTATAIASLANINPLSNGLIEMIDTNISVSGDASSQGEADSVQSNLVGGISAPFNSTYAITAPSAAVIAADTCQTDFNNLLASQNVNFESAQAVIAASSYALLNQMAATAANCPGASISVEGHTDSQGDDAYNLDLSDQRAQAVVSYLINQGVDGNRLSSAGYGESMPIGDNDTPEGRAENRRIEFNVSAN